VINKLKFGMEMLPEVSLIVLDCMIEKNGILAPYMDSNGDILVLLMKICIRAIPVKELIN
jgi:hypothetical protein